MRTPEPGWYPDPADPLLQRWWDGRVWTDQVSRNGSVWTLALPLALPSRKKRRMPVWLWVLIGLIALVPAFLLSPWVAAAALVVLITGIVALAKGSRTWLGFRSRRSAATVTAVAAAAFLVFGGTAAAVQNSQPDQSVEASRFADTGTPTTESRSADDADESAAVVTPSPTPVTEISEETVKEEVPFEQSSVEDSTIAKGETVVTTAGKVGERTLTYRVTTVDGKETKREVVKEVITIEPVTEVTSVGTYVAPAPAPAQPSNCHGSYADACVPIASDVDCAWGSGNGPAYFDGVARVVGPDVYDLDRDGDGWACEQ